MPVHDWQFWVVTAIAACAAFFVLREVVPPRFWPGKKTRRGKTTTLTIAGKNPAKKR